MNIEQNILAVRYAPTKISKKQFFDEEVDGFYYTGHASCLIRLSGKYYLFDPVIKSQPYGGGWKFFPENDFDFDLKLLDGIFVSHIHQDHYDKNFLSEIQGSIPLYAFDGRPAFKEDADLAGIKFTWLPPEEIIEIDPGIFVAGTLNYKNMVDASCIIGNENVRIYHGNDNYCDPRQLTEISDLMGGVHVACIPFAYINWYPNLIENMSEREKQSETNRLTLEYYEKAIDQMKAMKASVMVPFGANLFKAEPSLSKANAEIKPPVAFFNYYNNRKPKMEDYVVANFGSGDCILFSSDTILLSEQDEYTTEAQFREKFDLALMSCNSEEAESAGLISPQCTISSKAFKAKLAEIQQRVESCDLKLKRRAIVISDKDFSEERAVLIVFDEEGCCRVSVVGLAELANIRFDLNHFKLVSSVFKAYVEGDLSMENVIGTRDFLLFREPNYYDQQVLTFVTTIL